MARELSIAILSLMFYFAFGIAAAICVDQDDPSCTGFSLVTLVIKSLILLAIIVAMNYTVTLLKSVLYHSPWVPSTPIQYARSKQYQIFRLMFIVYLLMPTVFILIKVCFIFVQYRTCIEQREMSSICIIDNYCFIYCESLFAGHNVLVERNLDSFCIE